MVLKYKILLLFSFIFTLLCCSQEKYTFVESENIKFAREQLSSAIKKATLKDSVKIHFVKDKNISAAEAFHISIEENTINISAASEAGILYGCLNLRDRVNEGGKLLAGFELKDSPDMRWRGISLQLMKLGKYNYAITEDEFPFFYDKELWLKFMDFMLNQKFNYIILWNGHPFDYFVKFNEYKEAQSGMSEQQIEQNSTMLKWLIAEGQKRNIKIFFEFYNINTSVYYQAAHNLPDEISVPTPELAAYTKYSISKFVSAFPEVGLFVTPGEGLGREYTSDWINNVIFKAVKETGQEPVIFMRAWFFDLEHARKILDNYAKLYFVRKFNVEMIADRRPDPENSEWARLNGNFIVNIHLSANLEPFRWNPPFYIQDIVKNNIASGANGIHLHPRKAWRWPFGSDIGIDLFQWQRDTLFFTAWSRYAWKAQRPEKDEQAWWLDLLTRRYGNQDAAQHMLNSFEIGADVLPALQRLVWLGHDNHTIVSAGATLMQLKNSRGIPFLSISPTLRISEYLEALKEGRKIDGETPIAFLKKKMDQATNALDEAKLALRGSKNNIVEARRIVSDAQAVLYTAEFYWYKLKALKSWMLLDAGINEEQNKTLFLAELVESVNAYERLCQITEKNYESVSDVSARHPVRFPKTPYHWHDLLSVYQRELDIYKDELSIKRGADFYKPILKGLSGIFYSEPGFVDAEESYPADVIDFNWDNNQQIGRNWSIRWSGFIHSSYSGDIKIKFSADREATLLLNKKMLKINGGSATSATLLITMEEGKFYPVEISYNHNGGEGGFVKLEWSRDDQSPQLIPKKNLFHSKAQKSKISLLEKLIEATQ